MRRFNGVRSVTTFALGSAAVLCGAPARAADFAQDAYTAPAAPADLLWVERAAPVSESGASVKPFARLTLGFADDSLVLVSEDGSAERVLIDSELGGYLSGGVTLGRRFQVALLVPVYLRNQGSDGSYDLDGVIAGDPGVDLRLTLLPRQSPVELALAGTIRAPLGGEKAFASDGSVSAWPRAILSVPFGARSFVSLGAGPVLRPSTSEQSLNVSDALKLAGGMHLGLTEQWGLTGEVAGSTPFADPFARGRTPLELAAGVRFQSGPWVAAAGGGPGLTNGFGTPDFRLLASLGAAFGDSAPPPPPPADTDPDRDGVHGAADRCPHEAEDKDGFEDQDGCPDPDNDGDGIADAADRCPSEAEDKDGWQDDDGCPDPDNDGDSIADADDKCPNEAEDKDGWQDDDGCPDPDNDGDGILDERDQCPTEAETVNGIDDSDGCPDLIRVESGQIRTLEPIFFEYNRAKIQPRSEPMLLEMANLIRSRADLGRISIEGYTDDRGADAYNLKLSRERAEAVLSFLVAAGVDSARLEAHGFGEARPIDDNKTEAGRARNRRVDFRLVDLVGAAEPHTP